MPELDHPRQLSLVRLLPVIAALAFTAMVAIGETDIRRSANWPPPARHELGGLYVQDPAVLVWAAAINLPATVPVLLLWAHNDAFAYAMDDHQLFVYLPWLLLVILLWCLVAYRIGRWRNRLRESQPKRYLALCAQVLIMMEIFYVASLTIAAPSAMEHSTTMDVFVWVWLLIVILGWVDLVYSRVAARQ